MSRLEPHALIRGNHDKVGSGVESPEGFNAVARSAIRWTFEALTDENRDWLAALPAGPMIVDDLIEICHGTPFDEDAYVFDDLDALRAMHAARRPLCLFGHTHVQVGYYLSRDQFTLSTADDAAAADDSRSRTPITWSIRDRSASRATAIRAPASPRRHRAAQIDDLRVDYPVDEAQARISKRGCRTSSRSDSRSAAFDLRARRVSIRFGQTQFLRVSRFRRSLA